MGLLFVFVFSQDNSLTPSPDTFTDKGGYYEMPNGLIIQWGKIKNVYFDETHYETVSFIKSFPHKCFSVLASTNQETIIEGMRTVYVVSYDSTHAIFLPGYTKKRITGSITWFAIGY